MYQKQSIVSMYEWDLSIKKRINLFYLFIYQKNFNS